MEENRQAIQAYYYLVKFFGYENTVAAFLNWKDKFKDSF